jgi:hypothetical protein
MCYLHLAEIWPYQNKQVLVLRVLYASSFLPKDVIKEIKAAGTYY